MLQGTTINSALAIPKDVGLTKRKPNYVIWLQIKHYSTIIRDYKKPLSHQTPSFLLIIIIIIIYNLYRGKAPVTGSDFQGGPLKIKYTKAKNIQYN